VKPLKSDHIGGGDFWSLWRGCSLSEVTKCISTIGESAFGGRISGPCREVTSIMVPSRRVHYRRFHCNGQNVESL
jgi:hypothetical protein